MRVTQSMLSNNMLRNLSDSYSKMGKLQDQLTTGKKVNRPSDDPVVAMKGIGYRTQLDKVQQFQRNLGEAHSWLDSTDDTLDKVGSAIHRANELMISAADGTKTPQDRAMIAEEIKQLQEHVQDLANTKIGDKFIFSGTKTDTPLSANGAIGTDAAFDKPVEFEVFDGVTVQVNTNARQLFTDMNKTFDDMLTNLDTGENLDQSIGEVQGQLDSLLEMRANVGARQNRVELMENRLATQEIIATKQMSENENIDYEEVITEMITQESVHRAALSVGAKIIQPTLVDFLR
ncbi:flagellar hook-associated protein FlgL [Indiicoccus explosivorum]|uniref:flagellar hook-associated protein FlgL n=1 Tax=Indiicoccus explosivorum TaxID=1917864 RepID=UPI000B443170|nr:flagellar hook-associated protein FlgL [Indiicoccus explosivorum]